jgi:3-deoxy-D-manno-octulosonate 8-phosphate phosphatase (KDO 8-P phosphatase)
MNYRKKLKEIKALLFDVDGVFSKDFIVSHNAEFYRLMNPKDGYAMKKAVEEGFFTGIITGGSSQAVKERFNSLGVTDVYLGQYNKIEALDDFCAKYSLDYSQILYMGDDLPDYEVLMVVGFSACPADAATEVINLVNYVSDKKAGEGCVRDIIEQVLKVQKKWNIGES